jgi:hypothetical protein
VRDDPASRPAAGASAGHPDLDTPLTLDTGFAYGVGYEMPDLDGDPLVDEEGVDHHPAVDALEDLGLLLEAGASVLEAGYDREESMALYRVRLTVRQAFAIDTLFGTEDEHLAEVIVVASGVDGEDDAAAFEAAVSRVAADVARLRDEWRAGGGRTLRELDDDDAGTSGTAGE